MNTKESEIVQAFMDGAKLALESSSRMAQDDEPAKPLTRWQYLKLAIMGEN